MIRRIVFFTLLIVTTQLFSQRTSSSPYSIFGAGEELATMTAEQFAMGGIGAAYRSNRFLNFVNPAAISNLQYTVYTFGLLNNRINIKGAPTSQNTNTTSLSYIAIGIPLIKNKFGFVAGMQPTSAVGYSLINTITDSEGLAIDITEFSGSGSVNRVYGGFGYTIFKGFSLGFEADFLFGNIENEVLNARRDVAFATKSNEVLDVRGGSIKVGVQYQKKTEKNLNLTLGAAFKLGNSQRITGQENIYSLAFSPAGNEVPRDTLFSGAVRGNIKRPLETTLGVGLGKSEKWFVSADYKFRDGFNSTGFLVNSSQTFRYGQSNRISLGGFYLPKFNSITSYWDRVTYRAGIKFEKTGLQVNGNPSGSTFTDINDFGISFGLGLPIGRRLPSNLNFVFEFGRRGTTDNNLLQENYFNLRMSLSLNEIWFKKRRID